MEYPNLSARPIFTPMEAEGVLMNAINIVKGDFMHGRQELYSPQELLDGVATALRESVCGMAFDAFETATANAIC